MDENYLFVLVFLGLISAVLFKKEKKISLDNRDEKHSSLHHSSSTGTGVSRYLQSQQHDAVPEVTGVARYLKEKEGVMAENAVSSVAKYLASKEETSISGVSKYMARRAVQAKRLAKENVSGVEKYLNRRG